jgi:hypothetical protein
MPDIGVKGFFVFGAVRDRHKTTQKGGENMKTGIIVYVTGDDARMDADRQARLVKERMNASRVEIVSKNHGHNDVSDAWWSLTAKGMHRIICLMASCSGADNLLLQGRQIRLCG